MARKRIGILQPVYLPWLGYFEQMALVDHFVFLDDVQYTRHDWRNRNRIKTANGSLWLTVPVRRHRRSTPIHRIEISYRESWVRRHLRSIELNYRKAPGFEPLFGDLRRELEAAPARLVDLDCGLILMLCGYLGISTPTSFASEVPSAAAADKNQRIIDICLHHGADLLYDGARARDFIDVERFAEAGIEVVFQDYQHPVYPQAHGEFLSHQSIIDLIMNTADEAAAILRSSPVPERLRRPGAERRSA